MIMAKEKNRRRRLYLAQTSQPRILITMLALLGLVAVILMVFVYVDTNLRLSERYPGFNTVQPVILSALVIVNLFAAVFSLVLILLFSHRIAGPIYNLGRVLRSVAQGDLSTEIRFRKKDFLQEIADDGNLALEYLRQEIGEMQKLSEELVNRLEGSGGNPGPEVEAVEEARALRDRLGQFRITADQE
jgi:methyl-accepting chemotaxis protein